MAELLYQGAEGKVLSTTFLGRPAVCKVRLSKKYRVSELDTRINRQRLLQEARCIAKCKRFGVSTPCVYFVDLANNSLYLEKIDGVLVKQHLWSEFIEGCDLTAFESLACAIGQTIGLMHDAEIVHGDLTTSNMMLKVNENNEMSIVLIDFGLGSMKPTAEDKAVDLYVLERAFLSTHPGTESLVERILEHYRFGSKKGTTVLLKLDQVRQRGRKRDMLG